MDNKEKILECALNLFYSRGYDAVGVQEIAEKAGVTKPTLYHYFGSKYGLLETLLSVKFSQLNKQMRMAADYDGDVPEMLYRMAGTLIDIANANRKMYMLMMALFYSARENEAFHAIYPWMQEFYGIVVQVFEKKAYYLGNMRGRQNQFALGFLGILNQYLVYMCSEITEGETIDGMAVKELVDQFMYGIHS